MKPLDDWELDAFEYYGHSSGTDTSGLVRHRIKRACAELRELRALHLSDEDREALKFARELMALWQPWGSPDIEEHPRALAVLDRLIGEEK